MLYSFLLSLFYETSQITALFGIYPGPYRLADIGDLICNTLGGAAGFYIASVFAAVLPSRDEIDEKCRAHGTKVTGMRRLWAAVFIIDIMILGLIFILRIYFFIYFINVILRKGKLMPHDRLSGTLYMVTDIPEKTSSKMI